MSTNSMPIVQPVANQQQPLDIVCPLCKAEPGQECVTKSGKPARSTHMLRTYSVVRTQFVEEEMPVIAEAPVVPANANPTSKVVVMGAVPEQRKSKMAMHVLLNGHTEGAGDLAIGYVTRIERRPMLDRTKKYTQEELVKFFRPEFETRGTLDELVPDGFSYIIISFESSGKAGSEAMAAKVRDMRRKAYVDEATDKRYRCVYADVTDKGTMLYVEIGSGIEKPLDLGLIISDDPKTPKRVRRIFAYHPIMLEGRVIGSQNDPTGLVYAVRLSSGKEINVKFYDMDLLDERQLGVVDGMGVGNLKGFDGVMGTLVSDQGLGKGVYHANHRVHYDVVIYGAKSEVKIEGNKIFIGSLGEVGEHQAYMDIQSMINFGWYDKHLCVASGIRVMQEMAEIMFRGSESQGRELMASLARVSDREQEKDPSAQPWALIRAAELNHQIKTQPVWQRRWSNLVFETAVDIPAGRIPLFNQFKRLYVRPNPIMFEADGTPNLSKDVLGKNVCIPDVRPGPVWMARNPNTNANEGVGVINVHIPELMKYQGQGYVFLGADANQILPKLNGGDMDDSVLVTWDMDFIKKAFGMNYPKVAKIVAIDGGVRNVRAINNPHVQANQLLHKGRTGTWNFNTFEAQLDQYTEYQTSLGTFINRITLDTMLSGEHRATILANLKAGKYTVPANFVAPSVAELAKIIPGFTPDAEYDGKTVESFITHVCIPFYSSRPDFLCRRAASNSDLVIDYTQMRKGDKRVVDMLYKESELAIQTPFFPVSYANRVPGARAGSYILVETQVCEALRLLAEERDRILEASHQLEHLLVRPLAPQLTEAFMADDEHIVMRAKIIRSEWIQGHAEAKLNNYGLAKGANAKEMKKAVDDNFDLLAKAMQAKVEGDDFGDVFSPETQYAITIAYFNLIYSRKTDPKIDDRGFTMSVGDGAPNFMLNNLLSAEEAIGITGQVVFVDLNRKGRAYLKDITGRTDVVVRTGQVLRKADGLALSDKLYPAIPDGSYRISPMGVIEVRDSIAALHSDYVAQASSEAVELMDMELDQDIEF